MKENKFHKTKKDRNGQYFDHKNNLKRDNEAKNFSILPHPATLESYESISPGITEKLSQIIVKEQDFRHKKELLHIKGVHNIYRLGQLLSTILSITLIYVTLLILTEHNNELLAGTVCISGFTFLTIINVFSFKNITSFKENHKKHR